jgi:hypothetical protein
LNTPPSSAFSKLRSQRCGHSSPFLCHCFWVLPRLCLDRVQTHPRQFLRGRVPPYIQLTHTSLQSTPATSHTHMDYSSLVRISASIRCPPFHFQSQPSHLQDYPQLALYQTRHHTGTRRSRTTESRHSSPMARHGKSTATSRTMGRREMA